MTDAGSGSVAHVAPAAGAAAFGSGLLATTASVVRNRPAMDAAFCRAERVTLTGSRRGGQQILVGVGGGVETLTLRQLANLVEHHVTGHAGVLGDLLDRGFDGAEHDGGTGSLFAGQGGDGSVFSALAAA